jgi:2-phospho-L-lactate/phosphoenolpyruvate guanylyltransferase
MKGQLNPVNQKGIWAVVPLKERCCAKQRLSSALTALERQELFEVMAHDVISTLVACKEIEGVLIVTRDPIGAALCWDYGVTVVAEPKGVGLNGAIQFAGNYLLRKGVRHMLVVPGDLPLIAETDICAIFDVHNWSGGLTLVPACGEGGTNCFLASPPGVVEPRFGPDSFRLHVEEARKTGTDTEILRLPHVALDIDRPVDIEKFWRMTATSTESSRTAEFLANCILPTGSHRLERNLIPHLSGELI